ncbi:MAG TPA: hypothetical protein VKQ11_11835 [Candidatus Sulfotelmatobacter sp.]|nr:hypothetical protein [Candidatus Sulfotelmatobacter sp.]
MVKNNSAKLGWWLAVCVVLALSCMAGAQQDKKAPAKSDVTGNYEGSAKNGDGEVIPLTLELTEKEGAITGMIRSSHGDFQISSGSRKEDAVTLEFDAQGTAGTISLHVNGDQLTGTWTAGGDGGPVDVKKAAAPPDKASGI